jgi:hypothetical protein
MGISGLRFVRAKRNPLPFITRARARLAVVSLSISSEYFFQIKTSVVVYRWRTFIRYISSPGQHGGRRR